jgi:hypothetical protein
LSALAALPYDAPVVLAVLLARLAEPEDFAQRALTRRKWARSLINGLLQSQKFAGALILSYHWRSCWRYSGHVKRARASSRQPCQDHPGTEWEKEGKPYARSA